MNETQSYFSKLTQGNVTAEFVLDSSGEPVFKQSGVRKHYKIIYRLQSARKSEIRKVIYRLDSSYYNPIREIKTKENDFELITTTFGEYPLSVEVYFEGEFESARDNFSVTKLLKQKYESLNNKGIAEAIRSIAEN